MRMLHGADCVSMFTSMVSVSSGYEAQSGSKTHDVWKVHVLTLQFWNSRFYMISGANIQIMT